MSLTVPKDDGRRPYPDAVVCLHAMYSLINSGQSSPEVVADSVRALASFNIPDSKPAESN